MLMFTCESSSGKGMLVGDVQEMVAAGGTLMMTIDLNPNEIVSLSFKLFSGFYWTFYSR